MSKEAERAAHAAAKEKLVLEGQLYRVSVAHAKAQVAHSLRPDTLVHNAIEHALGAVQHRFAGLFSHGHADAQHAAAGHGAASGAGGGLLGSLGGVAGLIGLVKGMGITRTLPLALKAGSFLLARRRLAKPLLLAGAAAAAGGWWLARQNKR